LAVSIKLDIVSSFNPAITILGTDANKVKTYDHPKSLQTDVYSSLIHTHQTLKAGKMSISRWIK
jgi:hypothetical protein